MGDPHAIETPEALREIIGEPMAGLGQKNLDRLYPEARDYIARAPFLVLATADAHGRMDASPKGDAPGFCLALDDRTLLVPERPGNKLAYGLTNILANPRVGLIFFVPGTPETVRVNGTATLTRDPAWMERLAARGRPASLAIRVHVEECFHHCAKAFLRSGLWKPEGWPERMKISFGKIAVNNLSVPDAAAEQIDGAVEQDYRENL